MYYYIQRLPLSSRIGLFQIPSRFRGNFKPRHERLTFINNSLDNRGEKAGRKIVMNYLTKKNFDINLLRCLLTLIAEAHVTRAAERLEMTQPAMSVILAKLRNIFNDPLLVRTERGMVPTARALEIASQVQNALLLLDQAVSSSASFDPSTTRVHLRLIASESVLMPFVPHLVAYLRKNAPRITLSVQAPDLPHVRKMLEEGSADFILAFVRPSFDGLRSLPLFKQRLVVIAAGNHPEIHGRLTLDQFTRFPHAYYDAGGGGTSMIEARVDEALAKVGARRTIAICLPSALSSPAVVAASDLLATVPDRVARHFARELNLQVLKLPMALKDIEIAAYWHERLHNSLPHRWLRERMRETAEALKDSGRTGK